MERGGTRAVLERVTSSGTVTARSDSSVHQLFPVAIPTSEGEALRGRVEHERARQTIEIGLGYGVAALYILDGMAAYGRHLAIDPNQATRFANIGLQLIEDAGAIDRVEFVARPSEICLPELLAAGRTFDFAFVDGNHRFDGVFVDLAYLGRLVRPGGVIFLDDYHLPSIAKAAGFFSANLGWSVEESSTTDPHHGWAVLRTADPPRPRNYDHFVDF